VRSLEEGVLKNDKPEKGDWEYTDRDSTSPSGTLSRDGGKMDQPTDKGAEEEETSTRVRIREGGELPRQVNNKREKN